MKKASILIILFIQSIGPSWGLWNGEVANPGQFPATVYFDSCTGTRIGPRHILTAAHCVYQISVFIKKELSSYGYYLFGYGEGQLISLYQGADPGYAREFRHQIAKVHIHPSYKNIRLHKELENSVDIAVIELREYLNPAIRMASIRTTPVDIGEILILAGHGLTAPRFINFDSFGGNGFVNSSSSISTKLHFAESEVGDLNYKQIVIYGSGHDEPLPGDLPLLWSGDSGGAAFDLSDPLNLV
jgi:hypothetical protein